ncbi:MAG TPA: class I SAM-dependent methyltransferase [Candidatus Saccharimonadales bacterium]|nr:class I SAM-dependent methyltransferase [Candidatus Saccharimonadales bacterium]
MRTDGTLPGELGETFNTQDCGSEIGPAIDTDEAAMLRAAQLNRDARAWQQARGHTLDFSCYASKFNLQPYDPEPAQVLLARHEAVGYPHHCSFGEADLVIDEGVFSPDLTRVSPFLLYAVDFKPGERVLDAFSGSGGLGINAALHGADSVVAFDTSTKATACIQKNAERNGVGTIVDARQGTLTETITPDETFDLIIANPPLIPGNPDKGLESALFDTGLQATRELVTALPGLLTKRGRCYLLTSDVVDRQGYECHIDQLCRQQELRFLTVAQLHLRYESYRVHKIEHWTGGRRIGAAMNWLMDGEIAIGTR